MTNHKCENPNYIILQKMTPLIKGCKNPMNLRIGTLMWWELPNSHQFSTCCISREIVAPILQGFGAILNIDEIQLLKFYSSLFLQHVEAPKWVKIWFDCITRIVTLSFYLTYQI
jgi:hypothetical protein